MSSLNSRHLSALKINRDISLCSHVKISVKESKRFSQLSQAEYRPFGIISYLKYSVSRYNEMAFFHYTKSDCCSTGIIDQRLTLTTPQIIAFYGYPSEAHTIVTEDGYILTLHRIPFSKTSSKRNLKKTVLLHHGLLGSSADWLLSGPDKSLALILSDKGYDVWLSNVRGNTYSRGHISIPPKNQEFWDFSWHDVACYDLPASIDFIRNLKGDDIELSYIGFSMGTTILFVMLSLKPEYNKKLKGGFVMAPVAFMSNIKTPLRHIAPFANDISFVLNKLGGLGEFLPQNGTINWLLKLEKGLNQYEKLIVKNILFILCGFDRKQFDVDLLPLILAHNPAGASTKTLVHFAQLIKSKGKFQQFDYGPDENYNLYGSTEPPEYELCRITLPLMITSSKNDWLSSENDALRLCQQVSNCIEHYIVPYDDFNHLDFLWAIDVEKLVYERLLKFL